MQGVTGIGGVFVKSRNKEALRAWYRERLGVPAEEYGWSFEWRERESPETLGYSVWGLFDETSAYFEPSDRPFMVNFRVADLDGLLARLRAAGERVDDKVEDYDYGRFGWVMDPDGTRLELWQPAAPAPAAPAELEAFCRALLAAVDAGDLAALARLLDERASVYFPHGEATGLVRGAPAIRERFRALFETWRAAGRRPPYVGFEPEGFAAAELAPGLALCTFELAIEGAAGRRTVIAGRSPEGWRLRHMHASNIG